MAGKRKKSRLCRANLHRWENGPGERCLDCRDNDYLFADRAAMLALHVTADKPHPSHRLDVDTPIEDMLN